MIKKEIKLENGRIMIFHAGSSEEMYENVNWRLNTFWHKEPETINWIKTSVKPKSVFWDIGANIGQYGILAACLHGCQSYLIEPEPLNNSIAALNVMYNNLKNVVSVPIALSSERGYNNIRIQDVAGSSNLSLNKKTEGRTKQIVWTDTIDSLVKEGFTFPTHLKIDVDGVEQNILEGAVETLPKVESILIETDEKLIDEVASFLLPFGFKNFTTHKRGVPGIFNLIFSR